MDEWPVLTVVATNVPVSFCGPDNDDLNLAFVCIYQEKSVLFLASQHEERKTWRWPDDCFPLSVDAVNLSCYFISTLVEVVFHVVLASLHFFSSHRLHIYCSYHTKYFCAFVVASGVIVF